MAFFSPAKGAFGGFRAVTSHVLTGTPRSATIHLKIDISMPHNPRFW